MSIAHMALSDACVSQCDAHTSPLPGAGAKSSTVQARISHLEGFLEMNISNAFPVVFIINVGKSVLSLEREVMSLSTGLPVQWAASHFFSIASW